MRLKTTPRARAANPSRASRAPSLATRRTLDRSPKRRPRARHGLGPIGSRHVPPPWLNPLEPGRRRTRGRGPMRALATCVLAAAGVAVVTVLGLLNPLAGGVDLVVVVGVIGGALARQG
jgi:hypothetical protein